MRRIILCERCEGETVMDVAKVLLDGAQECGTCGQRHVLAPDELARTRLMLGTAEGWFPEALQPA
jgi:transcription elongation factor Elf1